MSTNSVITRLHIKRALNLRLGVNVGIYSATLDDGSLGIRVYVRGPFRMMGDFQKPNSKPELDLFVEEVYHLWVFGNE